MATRIAVVEDNSGDLYLIKRAIGNAGVEIVHYADGEEAIEALCPKRSETAPDLILLDLNLPKRSGIEVLAAVRRKDCLPNVPVVVLTSSRSDTDRRKVETLGATKFVPKPPTLSEFLEIVRVTVHQFV